MIIEPDTIKMPAKRSSPRQALTKRKIPLPTSLHLGGWTAPLAPGHHKEVLNGAKLIASLRTQLIVSTEVNNGILWRLGVVSGASKGRRSRVYTVKGGDTSGN